MVTDHPTTFVIFGATGDLSKKKILPAIFDLFTRGMLPKNFKVVGFSRKELSDDGYKNFIKEALSDKGHDIESEKCVAFVNRSHYKPGDITKAETYNHLAEHLAEMDADTQICSNKLFYLAVPPTIYETIFSHLASSGLASPCVHLPGQAKEAWTRVLVEKPFGSNIDEAQRLDQLLGDLFSEQQIFRIDHYLAKETLQNILIFRFANPMFFPIWNKDYIKKIDIKIYEKAGVSSRGTFYDNIGALRDVGQNHILQMLALVTMNDPKELTSEAIRKARVDLLRKVVPAGQSISDYAIRGQYKDYQNIEGVYEDSNTETYFKVKVNINDDSWKGVPIYLESGKALKEDVQEITVTFKELASCVCPVNDNRNHANKVTFMIKPDEGIEVKFWAKKPGFDFELEEKNLSFNYDTDTRIPDAYERVLYDSIKGDQTLFTSTEEVNAQWGIITPICEKWNSIELVKYEVGEEPDNIGGNKL
ncbi:MAG: glucose-6-phosphate 1-dehydrogenase [Candidatus Paceibacteria bacterium]|jgi:glucose-6-phosphate 1-dehydrogenase